MNFFGFLILCTVCKPALTVASDGRWVTDGSSELSIHGDRVEMAKPHEGESMNYNAIWTRGEGATSGKHYWKISFKDLSSEGAFVGLTDLDHFKKGWKFNGLMYGGNLADGSVLLESDFGPRFKSGDTIGILAYFDGDNLKVYFDINDKPLGLAFSVPKSTFKFVYAAVSFSGEGSATIKYVSTIPTDITRPKEFFTGKLGNWKLKQFKIKRVEARIPEEATMKIAGEISSNGSEKYDINLNVVNSISVGLKGFKGHQWKSIVGASSRVGGDRDTMKFESQVIVLLTNPTTVEIYGSDLIINNAENEMESKWERYVIEHPAYVGNPFSLH